MKYALFLGIMLFFWGAHGVHAALPGGVQQGIDPRTFVDVVRTPIAFPSNLFSRGIALPSMSGTDTSRGTRTVQSAIAPLIQFDQGLQNLNGQIKENLGIDVPVFVGAILRGLVWIWFAFFDILQHLVSVAAGK